MSRTWRQSVVTAAFIAAIVAVVVLNGRAAGSGLGAGETIHLAEVAHASGIDFVHQSPALDPKVNHIAAHIAALGACVSVADVNNDGWPDLYFTSSRFDAANALYLNQKDGTFRDMASAAGVAMVNRAGEGVSMGAVWGDYDNDGFEDLLVYKWGFPQLFHNLGNGHFEDVTAQSGLRPWMNSNGAVWLDFDRDGLLDLYITGYFRSDIDFWHLKTTRIMQSSWDFASNGGKNLLFKNMGNGRFKDVTDSMGVGSTRWTLGATAADFNDDGWPDLYLANDYGPEELYLNHEGKRFEQPVVVQVPKLRPPPPAPVGADAARAFVKPSQLLQGIGPQGAALTQKPLLGDVGDETVVPAAIVHAAQGDRHAAFGIVLETGARELEALALVVQVQLFGSVVVGEIEIGPAIVVEVGGRGPERPAS